VRFCNYFSNKIDAIDNTVFAVVLKKQSSDFKQTSVWFFNRHWVVWIADRTVRVLPKS